MSFHHGLFYTTPAQVFEDESLQDSEKMLYALVSNLSNNTGYCFASDKYLAEKRKCHESHIAKMLHNLEKAGYIERNTIKNGMKWDRKIFITHSSRKAYEGACKLPSKERTRSDRTSPQAPIVTKESSNKNPPLTPPTPKPPDPSPYTKEEEEEISRRLKERPKTAPPIKCMDKWRHKVGKSVRNDSEANKAHSEATEKHRREAIHWDESVWLGDKVTACREWVEFTCGHQCKQVRYDVSDEEWREKTGWK